MTSNVSSTDLNLKLHISQDGAETTAEQIWRVGEAVEGACYRVRSVQQ